MKHAEGNSDSPLAQAQTCGGDKSVNDVSLIVLLIIRSSIRVITKVPNTKQSSKEKGKTHKSRNWQNPLTTEKLGKPQWPWLGTAISKEMVGWIRF